MQKLAPQDANNIISGKVGQCNGLDWRLHALGQVVCRSDGNERGMASESGPCIDGKCIQSPRDLCRGGGRNY